MQKYSTINGHAMQFEMRFSKRRFTKHKNCKKDSIPRSECASRKKKRKNGPTILKVQIGSFLRRHLNFRLFCWMNSAADIGKMNIPETLIHNFVSIFTHETSRDSDNKTYSHETRNCHFIPSDCIWLLHERERYVDEQQLTGSSRRRIMVLTSRIDPLFISTWTS